MRIAVTPFQSNGPDISIAVTSVTKYLLRHHLMNVILCIFTSDLGQLNLLKVQLLSLVLVPQSELSTTFWTD